MIDASHIDRHGDLVLHYDEEAAARACDFFPAMLRHQKGELKGQPFVLDDWQRDYLIAPLFGWKRADGTRRFRTVYFEVPRKNGKTTLAAGVAIVLAFADGEPGAEVFAAAADRDQALIVHEIAAGMIRDEPLLDSRSTEYASTKRIVINGTDTVMKALSADAHTKHGLNAHGIIFDELHAQPNRELWDVLTTSTGARRQPLTMAITTAGHDRNSICWELRDYAMKVRDGIIEDPSFLPVIFAADDGDDWTSEETWKKANPGYGISVRPDYMEQKCREAQSSPAKENTFRRLHLNQWTEQDVRWLRMDRWDECGEDPIDRAALAGEPCFLGLDLSTTTDLTAGVLAFPRDGGEWIVLSHAWIPEEGARDREKRDRVPYRDWAKAGLVTLTPGDVIDYSHVRHWINERVSEFDVRQVAIDPWNAQQLATQLAEEDGLPVVSFRQGYRSYSSPCKDFEAMVLSRKLQHGGDPLLRWAASNVAVDTDPAGNMKPSKVKSTQRIDPIVAAIMAIGRGTAEAPQVENVVATRGLRFI